MKRSEMVEQIAEALLTLHGGDSDEQEWAREATKMSRLIAANKALSAAEQLGMLPPPLYGTVEVESTEEGLAVKIWGWEKEE